MKRAESRSDFNFIVRKIASLAYFDHNGMPPIADGGDGVRIRPIELRSITSSSESAAEIFKDIITRLRPVLIESDAYINISIKSRGE